jgi:hypothetical protein
MYVSTSLCWTLPAFSVFWSFNTVGRTPWTGDKLVAKLLLKICLLTTKLMDWSSDRKHLERWKSQQVTVPCENGIPSTYANCVGAIHTLIISRSLFEDAVSVPAYIYSRMIGLWSKINWKACETDRGLIKIASRNIWAWTEGKNRHPRQNSGNQFHFVVWKLYTLLTRRPCSTER